MANTVTTTPSLSGRALRHWRRRLLRGRRRTWDFELFHGLLAALSVLIALFAAVAVVGLTRDDGTVKLSVLFVTVVLCALVVARAAARAALRVAERRTAATAASEARVLVLALLARGAPMRAGAAASFVSSGADAIGAYIARAVPARTVAIWVPLAVLGVEAGVDPWSACICAAGLLAVPGLLVVLGRRATREAEVGIGRIRSLATRALELLEGAVELRALGALPRGSEELESATARAVESTRRSLRIGLQSATALDLVAGLSVGLVAMADGFRLLDGTVVLGHALAAVLLTVEVFAPLRAAGAAFHAGADGRAALSVLDAASTAARLPDRDAVATLPAIAAAPVTVTAFDATIVAAEGAPAALRDVRFSVPALGSLVVTGPSGCGKTTLLRAIAGARLVATGSVLVGNADAAALSNRQRAALLAVVDQRPFVVAGSVRDNLVLGLGAVDDAVLDDAIERCGLAEVLARHGGIDAQVGEEGRRLSAGERTRLALARAVVRAPGLLLLDEVGAHLDDAALGELRGSLDGFLRSRTVIEAAHDRVLLDDATRLDLSMQVAVR